MLILISGGSCSGKTTISKKISNACVISMDSFYRGKSFMTPPYNFDEPNAVDLDGLYDAVYKLNQGKTVKIPIYCMKKSERVGEVFVQPRSILVVEGIFVLHHKRLRDLADFKIYMEASEKERLKRRILRDVKKGRNKKETIKLSNKIENMHQIFGEPQKKYADLVLGE